MSTISERLEAATVKAESASEIAHDWANGPVNTTIPTESGPLPTLAEFMRVKAVEITEATGFKNSLAQVSSADLIAGVPAKFLASQSIDIRSYGGDPTGATNSRLAFKNAVAALKAAGGGELIFPEGSYLISGMDGTYTVPDLNSDIQWADTTTDAQLYFSNLENIIFKFLGSRLVSDKTDGGVTIMMDGCRNITFDNVDMQGATVMSGSTATVTGTTAIALLSTARDSDNIVFNSPKTNGHYAPIDILGNPASLYRVKNVIVDGVASFKNGYYGVICRGNGQAVRVKDAYTYRLNRPFFIYDTQNVHMNVTCDEINGGFQALIKAYTANVLNIRIKMTVKNRANVQACLGLQSQHNPALQPTPAYLRDIKIHYVDFASVEGGSSIKFDYYQNNTLTSSSNQFLFGDIEFQGRSSGSLSSGVALTAANNSCVLYAQQFKASNGFEIYSAGGGFVPANIASWTPADSSGAGLSLAVAQGRYTMGESVTCSFAVTYPTTTSVASASISGLPTKSHALPQSTFGVNIGYTDCGFAVYGLVSADGYQINWYKNTGVSVTNQELSGKTIRGTVTYFA